MKLSRVLNELVDERGLDRNTLSTIICDGMLVAYKKKYPHLILKAEHNKKTDDIVIMVQKIVTASPQDAEKEISLRKAKSIQSDIQLGETLWLPFEEAIGRIEILAAKQYIAQKIRTVEARAVYDEFKEKEGHIVHGIIHKCERSGMTLKIGEVLAFLPHSLSVPTDKCIVGYSLRALLKEVLAEPRYDNQLILDRVSTDFLLRLLELEIPEIFERLVEVKKIVRIPGYKSKVAVVSHDENIDPVGTCVGAGGLRIKPVLKELGNEKIDVIEWTDSKEKLVADALKPAVVDRVGVIDDEVAHVWIDEDQRSFALGKSGQNIALASRLVGIKIQLMQSETTKSQEESISDSFRDE